jgi:hypothetical protein
MTWITVPKRAIHPTPHPSRSPVAFGLARQLKLVVQVAPTGGWVKDAQRQDSVL